MRCTFSYIARLKFVIISALKFSLLLNEGCSLPVCAVVKGLVHPEMKSVMIWSPSCCSKPIRLLFTFRTQIKLFLISYPFCLSIESLRMHFFFFVQKEIVKVIYLNLLKSHKQIFYSHLNIDQHASDLLCLCINQCLYMNKG